MYLSVAESLFDASVTIKWLRNTVCDIGIRVVNRTRSELPGKAKLIIWFCNTYLQSEELLRLFGKQNILQTAGWPIIYQLYGAKIVNKGIAATFVTSVRRTVAIKRVDEY